MVKNASSGEREVASQSLIDVCLQLNNSGLNHGNSGNASVRWGDGLLITPTGMAYEALKPQDIVYMDLDGQVGKGQRRPSSEWAFHAALLKARPELRAVLHAHSPKATALAVLGQGLPPFHYMIAVAGGNTVRCAPYATFGTLELADHAVAAMQERKACLLANHGILTAGRDIDEAFKVLQEIETLCGIYIDACQLGEPVLLDDAEMAKVVAKFGGYGQQ